LLPGVRLYSLSKRLPSRFNQPRFRKNGGTAWTIYILDLLQNLPGEVQIALIASAVHNHLPTPIPPLTRRGPGIPEGDAGWAETEAS